MERERMKEEGGKRKEGRGKRKEERGRGLGKRARRADALFDLARAGNEDGHEFAGFCQQVAKAFGFDGAGVSQKFQPVHGFVEFLDAAFNLADELGVRAAAAGLTPVCPDRSPGPDDLPADCPCSQCSRQPVTELDDS